MNKHTNRIAKIAAAFMGILSLLVQAELAHAANFSGVSMSAYDTVAHFETMISVDGVAPQSVVRITVANPDGEQFAGQATAIAQGSAHITVPESKTDRAGTYTARLDGTTVQTTFTVFPGDMDTEKSGIFLSKATAATGKDSVFVTVRIVDEFLNPLPFHEVRVTSNRAEDVVTASRSETDSSGLATFVVRSGTPGSAVLTATDETSATVVNARAKILFVGSQTVVTKDIGGDPETILLAAGGSVAKFRIDNLPATVSVNDTASFTVTAVDSNGAVVSSYTGTVAFSSTDPNAKLPSPYTFKANDQGTMTFNVALSFATAGTQTLTVQEQGNPLVKGEKTVTVSAAHGAANGQVRITKPATGTYSLNTLEVAGEAVPNASVRLYDNGQQITQVQANASGRFSYTTSLLTDGTHTFYAESNGVQSAPVTVTIDSTPAQVQQVDITFQELAPGDSTSVIIRSDPNLSKVQIVVNDVVTDMEEDPQNPGLYRANITAPIQEGDYPISVVITDNVGNVSPAIQIGKLHVDSSLKQVGAGSFSVPSAVQNLRAAPGNAKVTLGWQAAQAESGIAYYRIYYGTNPQDLAIVVSTQNPNTTAEISNLQNGTPYYFQVSGVDTQGNESDNPSVIVNAVPSLNAGVPVLCEPDPCEAAGAPDGIPEDGPEVWAMIAASLLGGGTYRFVRRKKNAK